MNLRPLNTLQRAARITAASLVTCGLLTVLHVANTSAFPTASPGNCYDLRNDWSDLANPNGVWTLRAGSEVLPRVSIWPLDPSGAANGGWAFGNTVPHWFRSASFPPA